MTQKQRKNLNYFFKEKTSNFNKFYYPKPTSQSFKLSKPLSISLDFTQIEQMLSKIQSEQTTNNPPLIKGSKVDRNDK